MQKTTTTTKRRGRPPLDDNDPSVRVTITMPGKRYDELFAQASRDRTSIPEVIRRKLREEKQAANERG